MRPDGPSTRHSWQRVRESAAVLVALIAIVVGGCGAKLDHGKVIDKQFEAAHTNMSFMYIPDGNGGLMMIPQIDSVPDRWWITIKDGEQQATWGVTEKTYVAFAVGDELDFRREAR